MKTVASLTIAFLFSSSAFAAPDASVRLAERIVTDMSTLNDESEPQVEVSTELVHELKESSLYKIKVTKTNSNSKSTDNYSVVLTNEGKTIKAIVLR